MVDGASDEGEGDVVVHTRVGRTRFGAVESAFDDDFRRLMIDDFMFVGQGQGALMFVRRAVNYEYTWQGVTQQTPSSQTPCRLCEIHAETS